MEERRALALPNACPPNVGPWMVGSSRLRAFWSKHEASPRARTSCGRCHTEHWLSSESSQRNWAKSHANPSPQTFHHCSPQKYDKLLWFVAVSVVYTVWAMPKRQDLAFTRPTSPRSWGEPYLGDLSLKSPFVVFTFKPNCLQTALKSLWEVKLLIYSFILFGYHLKFCINEDRNKRTLPTSWF